MWSATTGRVASITGRERSDSTVISSLARRRHDVRRSSPPRTGRLHPAKRSPWPPTQVLLRGRGGPLVGDRPAGEHAERHRGTGRGRPGWTGRRSRAATTATTRPTRTCRGAPAGRPRTVRSPRRRGRRTPRATTATTRRTTSERGRRGSRRAAPAGPHRRPAGRGQDAVAEPPPGRRRRVAVRAGLAVRGRAV